MGEYRENEFRSVASSQTDESKEEVTEQIRPFSKIEALCLTAVLEECCERLQLLDQIMVKNAENKTVTIVNNTLDSEQESDLYLHQIIGERTNFLATITKLQKDSHYIGKVLCTLQGELLREGTYTILTDAIQQEKEQRKVLDETMLREVEMSKKVAILNNDIKEITDNLKKNLEDVANKISDEENRLQKTKERIAVELDYMMKKTETSVDQCEEQMTTNKEAKRKVLEEIKNKITIENEVHDRIDKYLSSTIQDLQEKTEYWTEKYDHDFAEKEKEFEALIAEKKEANHTLEKLHAIYEQYGKVIGEDDNRKKSEDVQQREERLKYFAAIKIQRWWRRCLEKKAEKRMKKKGKKSQLKVSVKKGTKTGRNLSKKKK